MFRLYDHSTNLCRLWLLMEWAFSAWAHFGLRGSPNTILLLENGTDITVASNNRWTLLNLAIDTS